MLFDTVSLQQYDHHGHDEKGHLFPIRCERNMLLSICLDNRIKQNGINFIIPEGNYCAELQVTLNKGKKYGKICSYSSKMCS